MHLIWFLLVGIIAGWLGSLLVKGEGLGLFGDMVLGIIGAYLGGFLFRSLGVGAGDGMVGSIIVATIGAVVLLLMVRLVKRS
ncbi:GlsB/YeaQ/YmgE family stress response membrane protein [Aquitalea aquatica]|uniref:GlsB/YeaQ/YmgE family stress response membrane protein n=1 Tax=Aquitalea aquatica TaxID=3044273 RepID=A0A838Y413_9NEIS|nr:GlsB/YeaQ/YmgE family stress response membrane protein [Aquitalea magnusonii]MBA4708628.1 GlsB/YeaQ/YmgE family stress response membrane protein [Aquitalea magnusonii]